MAPSRSQKKEEEEGKEGERYSASPALADFQELPGSQELRLMALEAEVNNTEILPRAGVLGQPPCSLLHALSSVLVERVGRLAWLAHRLQSMRQLLEKIFKSGNVFH